MEKLQDKRTMIIFLLVVLGIVIFMWLILPSHITISVPKLAQEQEQHEGFDSSDLKKAAENVGAEIAGKEGQVSKQVVSSDAPFIDSKTGTLIDGPGFERGEMEGVNSDVLSNIPSNYYMLDDGAGGELGLQNGLFSPACCSEQWPTPFKAKYDNFVCGNKDQLTTSSYFGNTTFSDSGCACMTKKLQAHLYNRGGNGREWF